MIWQGHTIFFCSSQHWVGEHTSLRLGVLTSFSSYQFRITTKKKHHCRHPDIAEGFIPWRFLADRSLWLICLYWDIQETAKHIYLFIFQFSSLFLSLCQSFYRWLLSGYQFPSWSADEKKTDLCSLEASLNIQTSILRKKVDKNNIW